MANEIEHIDIGIQLGQNFVLPRVVPMEINFFNQK